MSVWVFNFLKALNDFYSGNLIMSGFSVSAAMALLRLGAEGKTKKDFGNVLNFPASDEVLIDGFSQLLQSLEVRKKIKFSMI